MIISQRTSACSAFARCSRMKAQDPDIEVQSLLARTVQAPMPGILRAPYLNGELHLWVSPSNCMKPNFCPRFRSPIRRIITSTRKDSDSRGDACITIAGKSVRIGPVQ